MVARGHEIYLQLLASMPTEQRAVLSHTRCLEPLAGHRAGTTYLYRLLYTHILQQNADSHQRFKACILP